MNKLEELASTYMWLSIGWVFVSGMGVFLHMLGGEAASLAYIAWALQALFIGLTIYYKRLIYLEKMAVEDAKKRRESRSQRRVGEDGYL